MDEQNIALSLKQVGYCVHRNDGVWWLQVGPFFCKTLDPMLALLPQSSRPKFQYSMLGYSHVVSDPNLATRTWPVMSLSKERISNFEVGQLKPRKRTSVRKALRQVEVRRIEAIEPVLDTLNEICVSAAQRTGNGKPPEYYLQKRQEWECYMVREFSIPNREWWGAYAEGRLVSYYYAYLIRTTMHIDAAKSHSNYLHLLPNDALLFTFLEYCRDLKSCDQVIFGWWSPDAPTLNRFKETYGFERKDVPVYRHERVSFKLLSKAAQIRCVITRGGS